MSKLPDNQKIILTNIPGSHDSTAYYIKSYGSVFAQTQTLTIEEQLKIGIRQFDIRVRENSYVSKLVCCSINGNEAENCNDLICNHGIFNCFQDPKLNKYITYKKVLETLKKFLIENPSEFIIIRTNCNLGDKQKILRRAKEIFFYILDNVIQFDKKLTIGEVRSKIVYDVYVGTDLENVHKNYVNYEVFKVSGELKIKELEIFFKSCIYSYEEAEQSSEDLFPYMYEISCTGEFDDIVPLPKKHADKVNAFIINYNLIKGFIYGWISFDFAEKDIVRKIIETNKYYE